MLVVRAVPVLVVPYESQSVGPLDDYLSRSLPSVSAQDFESPLNNPWPAVPLATIDVAVPGRPGGRQFVRVDANIGVEGVTNGAGQFYLGDEGGELSTIRNIIKDSTRTITGVFEVDSGTTETVTLYGRRRPAPAFVFAANLSQRRSREAMRSRSRPEVTPDGEGT